ncbi:MAG: hypothetical protein ACI9UN_005397 [Granulosicoccus sp.]|jgi:hypothetical protein
MKDEFEQDDEGCPHCEFYRIKYTRYGYVGTYLKVEHCICGNHRVRSISHNPA